MERTKATGTFKVIELSGKLNVREFGDNQSELFLDDDREPLAAKLHRLIGGKMVDCQSEFTGANRRKFLCLWGRVESGYEIRMNDDGYDSTLEWCKIEGVDLIAICRAWLGSTVKIIIDDQLQNGAQ